uniref:Uncharacterized protein n=1 Tax=Davidia involucrata TaxID=16924 RepID=A0A5B7C073_DAVIN
MEILCSLPRKFDGYRRTISSSHRRPAIAEQVRRHKALRHHRRPVNLNLHRLNLPTIDPILPPSPSTTPLYIVVGSIVATDLLVSHRKQHHHRKSITDQQPPLPSRC